MRELITLECTVCKNKNYFITKNKRKHPEKVTVNKFCKFCRKHSPHKEGKV